MNAPDQLRHRVAWALASIFVVSERSIDLEGVSEPWGAYYDIFVRQAFGSFFELLREVAFSPLMALMLTFESEYELFKCCAISSTVDATDIIGIR